MPASGSEFAPAKVNLFLHITGRRADGYHLLDSLAVFPDVGDQLRFTAFEDFTLEVAGPFAEGLSAGADNLVSRAGLALAAAAGVRASGRLTLEKHLPVASGIGGGSADAAAALRLLARMWGTELPAADLHTLALGLGADVPVCLASEPIRMGGVGEVLSAVPPLPPCGIVLVNPGVAVSTNDVFRARTGPFSNPARLAPAWPDLAGLIGDLEATTNDLQAPAATLCPAIAELIATLHAQPGCLMARMSGSGATCFALTRDAATAEAMARAVRRPQWWCWGGGLSPERTGRHFAAR